MTRRQMTRGNISFAPNSPKKIVGTKRVRVWDKLINMNGHEPLPHVSHTKKR